MGQINSHFIRVENISKSFGQIIALSNVSFEVAAGELVFITGHSGAGKTTLLRLILREMLPDAGHIIFDGSDITTLSKKEIPALRQKIGTVFQDYKLIAERTVRENVEVALAVLDAPQEEWRTRVDQVLKLVGLSERSELFPSQLSGGEMQRVSLARALVISPKLILADEPTGNLDWETSEEIMNIFTRINKEAKTVVIATHNKMLIEKSKGRVISLKHGKLVGDSRQRK
jgi:cell division transport system ATP-binding protein